ncbi:MAG TPA: zinc-binding dehydrogenase [Acidimicrobiales bacterium]|nr:zinc-binding dehydrogenase [Acidimicrobiales bacterium]
MRALQIERSLPRFAAARVAGRPAPLRLAEVEVPELPGPDWELVRPRLSGICGSDLATVSGRSSRWFEPIVSFPFVPGHEVVADTADGRRVVVEPVLHCRIRGVEPPCPACAAGRTNHCERLVAGHLGPGLQTGYCCDTGGGWSLALAAHRDQLHAIPAGWSDEAAVMVEPTACAVHAALLPPESAGGRAVVIGAGTIGLATIAAVHRLRDDITALIAVAKHPDQRRLARELGATTVVEPGEIRRAVRRATGSWMLDNGQLTGGADLVYDCVGSPESIAEALAVAAPGATVVLAGMPGHTGIDLTPLWQREIRLAGAYAYGPEPARGGRHSFDLAMDVVDAAGLERLVSAAYPLDRYTEAIDHAGSAGRRGAAKIVFDLRNEKRR